MSSERLHTAGSAQEIHSIENSTKLKTELDYQKAEDVLSNATQQLEDVSIRYEQVKARSEVFFEGSVLLEKAKEVLGLLEEEVNQMQLQLGRVADDVLLNLGIEQMLDAVNFFLTEFPDEFGKLTQEEIARSVLANVLPTYVNLTHYPHLNDHIQKRIEKALTMEPIEQIESVSKMQHTSRQKRPTVSKPRSTTEKEIEPSVNLVSLGKNVFAIDNKRYLLRLDEASSVVFKRLFDESILSEGWVSARELMEAQRVANVANMMRASDALDKLRTRFKKMGWSMSIEEESKRSWTNYRLSGINASYGITIKPNGSIYFEQKTIVIPDEDVRRLVDFMISHAGEEIEWGRIKREVFMPGEEPTPNRWAMLRVLANNILSHTPAVSIIENKSGKRGLGARYQTHGLTFISYEEKPKEVI